MLAKRHCWRFSHLGVYLLVTTAFAGRGGTSELAEIRNPSMAGLMVEMMGPWGEIIIAAGFDRFRLRRVLKLDHRQQKFRSLQPLIKHSRAFLRARTAQAAPSASLWLTNICVQICLVLIWLTGSDYNTLLTIASEMILVPISWSARSC